MCATDSPVFGSKDIVSTDLWSYVSLWLKRQQKDHAEEASFFWDQARDFYEASVRLPESSSPLTSYYFALNASKALLTLKQEGFNNSHGVSGRSSGSTRNLINERISFKTGGVLPTLSKLLGAAITTDQETEFELKSIFRMMPFIHRAYTLTYRSEVDLFIPVHNLVLRGQEGRSTYHLYMTPSSHHDHEGIQDSLPDRIEVCHGDVGNREFRSKAKYSWAEGTKGLERLIGFHRRIRRFILPIVGKGNKWYLRKGLDDTESSFRYSQLVLMFGAFHRLSEIVRYEPNRLREHFQQDHNWLMLEFIRIAPLQFALQVAAEMTGCEFCVLDVDESIHRDIHV